MKTRSRRFSVRPRKAPTRARCQAVALDRNLTDTGWELLVVQLRWVTLRRRQMDDVAAQLTQAMQDPT